MNQHWWKRIGGVMSVVIGTMAMFGCTEHQAQPDASEVPLTVGDILRCNRFLRFPFCCLPNDQRPFCRIVLRPEPDAGVDAGSTDAGIADSGRDSSLPRDSGIVDGGLPPADSGMPDSAAGDAGAADSGTADSGTADSGAPDSGTADSGAPDSGAPDSGTADSGTADSGAPDSGIPDSGVDAGSEGELEIEITLGFCPEVYITALPSATTVGQSIVVIADFSEAVPSNVFEWTSTSGTFDTTGAFTTNFTCTEPGSATITARVSSQDCRSESSEVIGCFAE